MKEDDGRFLVACMTVAGCFIAFYVFLAIKTIINSNQAIKTIRNSKKAEFLREGFVPYVPPPLRGSSQFESVRVIGSNTPSYQKIMRKFKSHCDEFPVIGFDIEWGNSPYGRGFVTLLQLQTYWGLCIYISLQYFATMPVEIKDILKNDKIIKVGVAPDIDAKYLLDDYSIKSTFDLRYMSALAYREPGTLAFMSELYLNLRLKKGSDKALNFDWNTPYLSEKQIEYAAKDAHAGIELYKFFASYLERLSHFQSEKEYVEYIIFKFCSKFLNINYNGAQGIPHGTIFQRMANY